MTKTLVTSSPAMLSQGDVFKTKQSDKTRSPYQRITKVIDARSVECEGIEESGNRKQRRLQAKQERKERKNRKPRLIDHENGGTIIK